MGTIIINNHVPPKINVDAIAILLQMGLYQDVAYGPDYYKYSTVGISLHMYVHGPLSC